MELGPFFTLKLFPLADLQKASLFLLILHSSKALVLILSHFFYLRTLAKDFLFILATFYATTSWISKRVVGEALHYSTPPHFLINDWSHWPDIFRHYNAGF
jgi:hypothetical protein